MRITRVEKLDSFWPQLRVLLDDCYPKPPRDVCDLLVSLYREGFPAWLAEDAGILVGFVCLVPNSKGGTLETLAVHPVLEGTGMGSHLVGALLAETPGVVTLTTRIPQYFAKFGFSEVVHLADGSIFMIRKC